MGAIVGLLSGWVHFCKMDPHFWPLWEEFYFPGKFRKKRRSSLKSSEIRNVFDFGYFGVSNTPY